ncbi:MAG TPA: cyclopropane fatty acyl phospholipid synthase [Candidatus Sumerlaeota bacterium]|nr:MAG: Cyclopropane-fatty-acyl-phospholipid synthase [candidate division BRC1 bacterium ADurb.BinA292]HOE95371.1 cyclopropane fatty acyl phospholipid synthase [Candidatus Sumerlaeota bacterium]HOR26932.1 cyclopropane fatty acyl phospholipid synthase [Candidatus Sumerlaeota bacterium]HPK01060.1 cyclopropane fatty acyl phospholipid synthase [Candidatus Sumerlaeota bacterium]
MLTGELTQAPAGRIPRGRALIDAILERADVRIDGGRPWDIQVHDPRFFNRVLAEGSIGLGESYMDRWWDCAALDELIARILRLDLSRRVQRNLRNAATVLWARVANRQTRTRSREVARRHYDLGNDFYAAMLDPYMQYSCGYWKEAENLAAAQEAKLELIGRKLALKAGERLLDIGCGWGGLLRFAAERFGVEAVGVTISERQAELARARCAGLPVEIRLQDYRDLREPFDKIVSVGMFEHVGHRNYRLFFEVARRCLKREGLLLLHTIGGNRSESCIDPWIDRYIFPNAMLPSARQIATAAEGLFVMEDWHNFGPYYDRTLMAWFDNFNDNWPRFREQYGDRFHRMWEFYLKSCAGGFRARVNQLWQIVYSPCGVEGGYTPVR